MAPPVACKNSQRNRSLLKLGASTRAQRPMSLVRGGAVEAKDYDLSGHDLRWPGKHCKAARYGNLLRAVRGIGDHAAADRAAKVLTPKFLAVGGIERIEVS